MAVNLLPDADTARKTAHYKRAGSGYVTGFVTGTTKRCVRRPGSGGAPVAILHGARAARVLREVHPVRGVPHCKSRTNRVGTVPVKKCGLVMKLRGVIHQLFPDCPRLSPLCFFLRRTLFFSFYLTGIGVFCMHLRPTADLPDAGGKSFVGLCLNSKC